MPIIAQGQKGLAYGRKERGNGKKNLNESC